MTPKPHQQEALRAIAASDAPRGIVNMACGTGKTFVAAMASLGHNGDAIDPTRIARCVVVLGPSIHIGAQSAKGDWLAAGRVATALVCSDDKALQADEEIDADERMEGVPVTTSAEEIAALVNGRDEWTLFGTYASGERIGQALHALGIAADLVIYDEAHRVAGSEEKAATALLYDETLPAKRRLFFTATPRVSRRGEPAPHGMDNVEMFGDTLYRLSTGQAIIDDLVADYRVKCVRVPEGTDITDKRAVLQALHVAIANAVKSGEIRNAFMFRHEIDRCDESVAILTKLGIYAVTVHGGQPGRPMPVRERERLIREVVARGGIAVTDKALAEGINVPDVDAVVFMDRKTSMIDIVQAIGRALRKSKDRPDKVAKIVVPFVTDDDRAVEITGMLGYLLDALRQEDARLEDMIRGEVRAVVGGGSRERGWADAHGLGDVLDDAAWGAVLRDVEGEFEWEWNAMCARVEAFVQREERLPREPGAAVPEDEGRAGDWCGKQRHAYRSGTLSRARIERLEQVSEWVWDVRADGWLTKHAAVRDFAANTGRLPRRSGPSVPPSEGVLGDWVGQQRKLRNKLSVERVALLETIPHWSWAGNRGKPVTDDGWAALRAGKPDSAGRARKVRSQRARLPVLRALRGGGLSLREMIDRGLRVASGNLLLSSIKDGLIARGGPRGQYTYCLTPAGHAELERLDYEAGEEVAK